MRILISNDDGIRATGIRELARALATEHEVHVVAPDRERSAQGHALTLHQPLRVEDYTAEFHRDNIQVKEAMAVSGTPSDCVKLALTTLMRDKPVDVVASGVNHGPNLGGDVVYSGTVSAALEAAMNNVPAIAFSAFNGQDDHCDFPDAARYIQAHFNELVALSGEAKKMVLNVNTPGVESKHYIGMKLCKLGLRMYTDFYEERQDPRGDRYYWLAGEMVSRDIDPEEDVDAIRNNYVTVTPIHADLTDVKMYLTLKDAFEHH